METGYSVGPNAAELLRQKRSGLLFHHPNIPTSPEDPDLLSSEDSNEEIDSVPGVFPEISKLKRSIPDMKDSVLPTQTLIKMTVPTENRHRRVKSTVLIVRSDSIQGREEFGRRSFGETSGEEVLLDSKMSEET